MNKISYHDVEYLLLGSTTNDKSMLFGYQLPFIPDFLFDHTLVSDNTKEKLDEVLSRFTKFIVNFRKFRSSAYSLRFLYNPENGNINVFLLGRLIGDLSNGENFVRLAALDLYQNLVTLGFSPILLKNSGDLNIDKVRNPFEKLNYSIVEVRQKEEVIQLTEGKAYVVYPFKGANGHFLDVFENMVSQSSPVMLSIYLEPVDIEQNEIQSIDNGAKFGMTLADQQRHTYSEMSSSHLRDPAAEMVGGLYISLRKSLDETFVGLVQSISPEPNVAWNIAKSFATAIGFSDFQTEDENTLSSKPIIHSPSKENYDLQAAKKTFELLKFSTWNNNLATSGKERFPYLMGAKTASTIFRFPVSIRGGIPGIPVRQTPPDFDPGPRLKSIPSDHISIGKTHQGSIISVPKNDLVRHALITGFTGSGKTNTVLFMLNQLWLKYKIPFLVIESSKKEYRSLSISKGYEDILIFTLGDETTSRFRFNPFELISGVRVEAHIGKLQACFDAALPQFGILPSIIAESLEIVYKEKGWNFTDRFESKLKESRLFPTMIDMLNVVTRVVGDRGYSGELGDNVKAASIGRIKGLLRGSKGRMFICQHSLPEKDIFCRPVVLELNDLNEDDKALTMLFLLTWLREYREYNQSSQLQHVTVIEEAHNVISNVASVSNTEVSSDTKAKAVSAFSNMLSEIRAYGEGIFISDQSPEKLAPDAIRNTNLQISHQLRDIKDRESIARSMIMDQSQEDYLGKLRVGEAAYFRTGMEKATFISVPEIQKSKITSNSTPKDSYIKSFMQSFLQKHEASTLPFDGCRYCPSKCTYRDIVETHINNTDVTNGLFLALSKFDIGQNEEQINNNWKQVVNSCFRISQLAGRPYHEGIAYCYLAHKIDFGFTESMYKQFQFAVKKGDSRK